MGQGGLVEVFRVLRIDSHKWCCYGLCCVGQIVPLGPPSVPMYRTEIVSAFK